MIGALLLRTPAARRFFDQLNDQYDIELNVEHIGDIDGSDRLRSLSEVFPTGRWVDYYKQHRYSGYVLGPRRHLAAMKVATRNVLSDRGIEIKGVSTPRG